MKKESVSTSSSCNRNRIIVEMILDAKGVLIIDRNGNIAFVFLQGVDSFRIFLHSRNCSRSFECAKHGKRGDALWLYSVSKKIKIIQSCQIII